MISAGTHVSRGRGVRGSVRVDRRSSVAERAPARLASGVTTPATRGLPKYSPLDQINKDNVERLRIAWRRPAVADELRAQNPTCASATRCDRRR